jgi:hypothetical protein
MASSIGFSDPTCMLVCAAEFSTRGRRYFPVSNACQPWKAGASSREKRERLNLRRIDHANPGSMKESGGRWKIYALRGRQLAGRLLVAKLRQPVETICKLPFLLRFHSCDLIRDCLAELSHRRSQIPSPASWRRAGEIILASSDDIVGIRRMRGAICLIRLRHSWPSFLGRPGSDRRYGGAGRCCGASFGKFAA